MKHLLLEVYCDCDMKNKKSIPYFCKSTVEIMGVKCFKNKCKHLSFTSVENEIAYVGKYGQVESYASDCIGFGGDMEDSTKGYETEELINIWENKCKEKIDEAYNDFINEISGGNNTKI